VVTSAVIPTALRDKDNSALYLWASFGAVHDGVASIHRPLISQLFQTLLLEVISWVHDPPTVMRNAI